MFSKEEEEEERGTDVNFSFKTTTPKKN